MKLWPNSTFKDIRYVRTKLELRDSREMDEKWSTTCHVLGQNDLRVESSLWSFWVQSSDLFLQVQIRKWILCHCNLKIETSFFYLLSNTKKSLFLSCHLWRQYILQVQKICFCNLMKIEVQCTAKSKMHSQTRAQYMDTVFDKHTIRKVKFLSKN